MNLTIESVHARGGAWPRILGVWARQELVLLLREPVAVFFSLAFPTLLYVFIGIPYGKTEVGPGIRFIDMMFPALIVTAMANLLLMGLPIYLAELRSRGADRRYRILPLPGAIFASSVLLATLVLVAASAGIIVVVVLLRDGLLPSVLSPGFIALAFGCLVWLSALGFFVGALRVSSRTTQALSAVLFFAMFFGSGAAAPIEGLPEILQRVLDWNPLKQWLDVMVGVYTGTEVTQIEYLRLLMAIPIAVIGIVGGLWLWRRTP